MRTTEQQEFDMQCYGCSQATLDEIMEEQSFFGPHMIIASLLSDAQHMISTDLNGIGNEVSTRRANMARQYMNRAKYYIFNMMEQYDDQRKAA